MNRFFEFVESRRRRKSRPATREETLRKVVEDCISILDELSASLKRTSLQQESLSLKQHYDRPLTIEEAAISLGMTQTHLVRMCEEGRVESFVVNNRRCVPRREVTRILQERQREHDRNKARRSRVARSMSWGMRP